MSTLHVGYIKNNAITRCLEERLRHKGLRNIRKTYVGASIYTSDNLTINGFNIENRCHKGIHAEEMAVLNCIQYGIDPKTVIGIIVSFSNQDIKRLTFCCGHCRQVLWEYTQNPDVLCTEVDLDGNIIKEVKLGDLYPYPYPR